MLAMLGAELDRGKPISWKRAHVDDIYLGMAAKLLDRQEDLRPGGLGKVEPASDSGI
jgi:hypothetical protein